MLDYYLQVVAYYDWGILYVISSDHITTVITLRFSRARGHKATCVCTVLGDSECLGLYAGRPALRRAAALHGPLPRSRFQRRGVLQVRFMR